MKVTLESTTKIVQVNGVYARIWEGETDTGIPVHAFVTRIAAPEKENQEQFKRELVECCEPRDERIKSYPMRMVL